MEVMTKKEAISLLKLAKAEIEWEYPLDYQLALDKAIEALEQEPILDKIRAEIIKLQTYKMFEGEDTVYVERDDVLEIIDKYRESEVKDVRLDV